MRHDRCQNLLATMVMAVCSLLGLSRGHRVIDFQNVLVVLLLEFCIWMWQPVEFDGVTLGMILVTTGDMLLRFSYRLVAFDTC